MTTWPTPSKRKTVALFDVQEFVRDISFGKNVRHVFNRLSLANIRNYAETNKHFDFKGSCEDGLPVMPVNEKDVAVVMRRLTENGHTP